MGALAAADPPQTAEMRQIMHAREKKIVWRLPGRSRTIWKDSNCGPGDATEPSEVANKGYPGPHKPYNFYMITNNIYWDWDYWAVCVNY